MGAQAVVTGPKVELRVLNGDVKMTLWEFVWLMLQTSRQTDSWGSRLLQLSLPRFTARSERRQGKATGGTRGVALWGFLQRALQRRYPLSLSTWALGATVALQTFPVE